MSLKIEEAKVISNEPIAKDIYKMVISAPNLVSQIKEPGQFINLYPKEKHTLLPRPISISSVDDESTLSVIYAVVGDGTNQFTKIKKDESIKISGPMGNGFKIKSDIKNHVIIGGGIGTPPLFELAKRLEGNITVVLGFQDEPILAQEFKSLGAKVFVCTDSGSVGYKGNVIDVLNKENISGDMFYSCGPKPMLKALNTWCNIKNIPIQVSLEERMACGIGVCVGCVCKQKDSSKKEGWTYKKTCSDGPVFMGNEVEWNE